MADAGSGPAEASHGGEDGGAAGTSKQQGAGERYNDQLTVFVKGLRPTAKDEDVKAFFEKLVADGIKTLRMPRDPATHQSRVGRAARVDCVGLAAPSARAQCGTGTGWTAVALLVPVPVVRALLSCGLVHLPPPPPPLPALDFPV